MQQANEANRQGAGLFRQCVFQAVVAGLLSLGFVQAAGAGVVTTYEAASQELRQGQIADLERLLARADVAAELERFGVSSSDVMARVDHLTDAEVAELKGTIDQQVAGGDAIAVIGVVFLVLLILELVGVTDIFKSL